MEAPVVNVGIMTEKAVSFVFHGEYVHTETGKFLTGEQRALFVNGNIVYNGRLFKEIFFEPASPSSSFELKAVTIGRNFHWQRQEDQCFKGAFNLVTGENGIVVINQVDVEEYLTSVISSEMSAQASKELLKAHAVISRSWLLAQIEKNFRLGRKEEKQQNCYRDNEQLIRWYDREDHNIFDVCADDHCQRYQGITRASNPIVQEVDPRDKGRNTGEWRNDLRCPLFQMLRRCDGTVRTLLGTDPPFLPDSIEGQSGNNFSGPHSGRRGPEMDSLCS